MARLIEKLAKEVGDALKEGGLKLVTAESCTGGGLSYWVTSIAGSSDWFDRGFVTYSDAAKSELLGVNPQTIATFGAVSEQTVREMAEGALNHSHADISIAVTGIAGPTGGSAQKPVGTVWIAWARRDYSTLASVDIFPGNRQTIRFLAIEKALQGLLERIRKINI